MDAKKIELQAGRIEILERFVEFLKGNWQDERTYLKIAFSDLRCVCPRLICFDSLLDEDDESHKEEFVNDLVTLVEKHIERLKVDLEELTKQP